MADGHQRFERLAVGHVVGGLDEVDAAAFRAHLVGCRSCRARVNELRQIASDLEAAERAERHSRARDVATAVRARQEEQAPPRDVRVTPWRSWPWRLVVIGLVPAVVMIALAWAVWVRTENQIMQATVAAQEVVLRVLAGGEPIAWTLTPPVEGLAAVDDATVVLDVAGLPELAADEGIVIWLLDDTGAPVSVEDPLLRSRIPDGRIAVALDRPPSATELLVTVETLPSDLAAPTGHRLAAGSLPSVPATDDTEDATEESRPASADGTDSAEPAGT